MIEVSSPSIKRKEMDAVLTVLVEEKIGPGEQAQRLIQIAKENLHFDFCMALRSPVIALAHALKLLQLEAGSGVAISALSPRYYEKVIADSGLKPLVCDIMPDAPFIKADGIDCAAIRCVVIHHTLGYMPNMEAFAALGVPVIEDCSHSVFSGFGERGGENFAASGSSGIFTILGLEERDLLTAGGGALLYAMERRNASVIRNAGELPAEYGIPDMNAAMAIVQFREAEKNLQRRKEYADLYLQAAMQQGRHKLFVQSDGFAYNNYAFPLVLETGMKDVVAWAKRKEIAVESAFESTLAGTDLVTQETCPNAYSLGLRTALFPIYPRLGGANAAKVAKLLQTLP